MNPAVIIIPVVGVLLILSIIALIKEKKDSEKREAKKDQEKVENYENWLSAQNAKIRKRIILLLYNEKRPMKDLNSLPDEVLEKLAKSDQLFLLKSIRAMLMYFTILSVISLFFGLVYIVIEYGRIY